MQTEAYAKAAAEQARMFRADAYTKMEAGDMPAAVHSFEQAELWQSIAAEEWERAAARHRKAAEILARRILAA